MFKAPAGRFFAAQAGKKVGQLIHIGVLYNVVAVAVVMLKAGVGVHKLFVTVLELIQRFGVALPEQVQTIAKAFKVAHRLGLTTSAASTPCAPEAWRSSRVTQSG